MKSERNDSNLSRFHLFIRAGRAACKPAERKMKITLSIVVLIMAGNLGFAQTTRVGDIRIIQLSDEVSSGVDKGFEISLEKGDLATFQGGQNFYGRKGKYCGAFDEQQFFEIAQLIIAKKFFALDNRYEGNTMDVGTRTITVIYRDRQKSVVNWGARHLKEFAAIEKAINELAAKIDWRRCTKSFAEQIESFFALLSSDFEDAQTKLDFGDFQIENNVGYERLENLISATHKAGEIPTLFFRARRPVLLYLNAQMLEARELKPQDFYNRFGKQFVQLRSRSGKTHQHILYPSEGIAFSTDGVRLDFLEVFQPTTIATYKREIYREPPAFRK